MFRRTSVEDGSSEMDLAWKLEDAAGERSFLCPKKNKHLWQEPVTRAYVAEGRRSFVSSFSSSAPLADNFCGVALEVRHCVMHGYLCR